LILSQRTHSILVIHPECYERCTRIKSVPLIWKGENRMAPCLGGKSNVVAMISIEFIQFLSSFARIIKPRIFCWLMLDIFLFKLCTYNLIVFSILRSLSSDFLVQVWCGEHLLDPTKCRELLRLITGSADWPRLNHWFDLLGLKR